MPLPGLKSILGGVGRSPFSVSYLGSPAAIETNSSSYTWTAVDFGTPDADRWIHVAYVGLKASSVDPVSVTIGGVAATIINNVGSGGWSFVMHAFAKVPAGASGDVVVTFGGTQDAGTIHVYRVVNPGAIPTSSNYYSTTGTSVSGSPTLTKDSYVIACSKADNANALTWTNLDEQSDFAFASGGRRASSAFRKTAASGALTITVAGSGSTLRKFDAIEWLP